MDSKPFDYKKLDALLAAAKDITGFPVTCIILQTEGAAYPITWLWSSAPTTTEMLEGGLAQVWPQAESLLKPDTEPNKNS